MALWVWSGFLALALVLVLLELGLFRRVRQAVNIKESLAWSLFWLTLGLAFTLPVSLLYGEDWLGWSDLAPHRLTGRQAVVQYLAGFLVEKSLSLDNLLVIALIFTRLRVPIGGQLRLLTWAVVGAVLLRAVMIALGAELLQRVWWSAYLFGALLIASGAKMLVVRHDNIDPQRNLVVRLLPRLLPLAGHPSGEGLLAARPGGTAATPLLVALLLVLSGTVMFAIDSVPAIFAITEDPFLVLTANVFSLLGLRSLYFALAGYLDRFRYLKNSLSFLLAYMGVKMILRVHHPVPNAVSLAIMGGLLAVGVLSSFVAISKDTAKLVSPLLDDLEGLLLLTYAQARRIAVLLIGSSVLLVGIAMIVLPGPAVVVIPLGLAILGLEFEWARRWLRAIRERLGRAARELTGNRRAGKG
jgi:tellurite resistance protein TerC